MLTGGVILFHYQTVNYRKTLCKCTNIRHRWKDYEVELKHKTFSTFLKDTVFLAF